MDDYLNLEDRDKQKAVLERFVQSIEGLDDEALHEVFTSRAVKKATWREADLLGALEQTVWKKPKKALKTKQWNDEEDVDFDEFFREVGDAE